MTKDDLYIKLLCALTHNLSDCKNCGKCDIKNKSARVNLIDELSKAFGKESPWNNIDELSKKN